MANHATGNALEKTMNQLLSIKVDKKERIIPIFLILTIWNHPQTRVKLICDQFPISKCIRLQVGILHCCMFLT